MKIRLGVLGGASLVGVAFWAGAGRAADKPESPKPPVVAPAAEKEKGPALPQAPLNHQVAAMGDNTWMKLETPKVRPIARSASPWMPYAPEAGVGILWGCGHSWHHNDVWTYTLSNNEWKEMLKTEPSAKEDPGVIKYKDGVLMTREERPLSAHQWGMMDYDPDRQVLWHMGGWWQGAYTVVAEVKKLGPIKQEGDPDKAKKEGLTGRMLWKYSLKDNKWSVVFTQDPTGCSKNACHAMIRYHPPLKKLIMTPHAIEPVEPGSAYRMYDPDTNRWEPLKVAVHPIDKDKGGQGWRHVPTVYDSKRQVFIVISGGTGTWIMDPVKKTLDQIITADKTPFGNLDGPCGAFVYDSASGTTLCLYVSYTFYDCGKVLAARGFPIDRTNVWALDIEKKEWVLQPKPADGVLPPANNLDTLHHFYDPVNNATLIYRGAYNNYGEAWVYRYKRAAK